MQFEVAIDKFLDKCGKCNLIADFADFPLKWQAGRTGKAAESTQMQRRWFG